MHTPSPSRTRRVAVLGGGPGGLYCARLLARARPDWEVELHETYHPEDTFGFGVGLSSSTQRNLARSDPETLREILAASHRGHGSRIHAAHGVVRLDGRDQLAIARGRLLSILHRSAVESGVVMRLGGHLDHRDLDADIVIAADGAGSATRRALADELGARVDRGRQLYLWCGTDVALPDAIFVSVHTEFGAFTTHAYPYAADRSTFLVETDETTWRAAGLDVATAEVPADESDTASITYLEEIFSRQLEGHRLLGNRTRWTRFRTVHCERWYAGRVVLVGDAAHTAHYSVGSGTKLAMEDAIALSEVLTALGPEDHLTEAFGAYQQRRVPEVARLQGLAERSQLWWESYVRRLELPPEQLALSFVSRAGNVPLDQFAARTPQIVGPALSSYAGRDAPATAPVVRWILDQPLRRAGRHFDGRVLDPDTLGDGLASVETDLADTWGDDASALVARCAALMDAGAVGLRLTGPPSRPAVLRRLDLGERLRLDLAERDPLVIVDGPPGLLTDLAAGLLSARTDLITLQEGSAS